VCLLSCENQYTGYDLYSQNDRDSYGKFQVSGFVAEGIYAQKRTDAAAENSNEQQCSFRDAPEFFSGFVLVRKHKHKTGCID